MATSSLTSLFLSSLIFVFKAGLVVVALLFARVLVWLFNMMVVAPPFDPLRKVPGPAGARMYSHLRECMDPELSPKTHENWVNRFGKTFKFHGFGAHDYRLMTFDFRAITHILNSPVYEKPWQTRTILTRLFGRGIFAMEGAEHRFQRKIIGPAFTTQAVKNYQPIFLQKALEVRNKWYDILDESASSSAGSGEEKQTKTTIDVLHWTTRAAFDIIGLAGLNYNFHAVREENEEMYLSYRKMFGVVDKAPGFWSILALFVPILDVIWPAEETKTIQESLEAIKRSGNGLLQERKEAMVLEKNSGIQSAEDAKDVASLLIKANLSEDPTKRMSDSDLLDQVSALVFGGSDTSALALSSALRLLAEHPHIQSQLRSELLEAFPDSDTIDALLSSSTNGTLNFDIDSLPFLDAVVRETLRLAPPVHGTIRVAMKDDLIPLSEPVVLSDGELVREIKIRKGTFIHIPIEGLNHSSSIHGPSPQQFNPDRWLSSSSSSSSNSNPWHHPGHLNTMTFSLGPHSCPGFRFSFWEIKFLLLVLVREFNFTRGKERLGVSNQVLTRPFVKGEWSKGARLPLVVERVEN